MKRILLMAACGLLAAGAQLDAQDSAAVESARCRAVFSLVRGFMMADPGGQQGPLGAVQGNLSVLRTRRFGVVGFSNPLTRTLGLRHAERFVGGEPAPIPIARRDRPFPLDGAPVVRCMYPIAERGSPIGRAP